MLDIDGFRKLPDGYKTDKLRVGKDRKCLEETVAGGNQVFKFIPRTAFVNGE